jgi:hypothetical protein
MPADILRQDLKIRRVKKNAVHAADSSKYFGFGDKGRHQIQNGINRKDCITLHFFVLALFERIDIGVTFPAAGGDVS